MKPMLKVSAAVLIAAMSALPALAAANAAVVMGTKTDIAPVATLDGMIGKWTKTELDALAKAASVTVLDTHTLYNANDLKMISATETADAKTLGTLRDQLGANADLKAWFAKNKIDMTKVIAITDVNGKVEIYTY